MYRVSMNFSLKCCGKEKYFILFYIQKIWTIKPCMGYSVGFLAKFNTMRYKLEISFVIKLAEKS